MSVKLSVCVVFARSGFKNEKSRMILVSCVQSTVVAVKLCDLSMSKRFILYVSMFRHIISIMYNFPIAFRNVYHQRCTTTDVCSRDPKENNTDDIV